MNHSADEPRAALDEAGAPDAADGDRGEVCWLERVCQECGALVDGPLPRECWRCGSLVDPA